MATNKKHIVAIIGGAVSGAEAAYQLSRQGIITVVFDQNALPYGKIVDGLPKWHVKLRKKEEDRINEKLDHPSVYYVPGTRLGRDLNLNELLEDWGFSAVILATGAWRDRPLPVEGIDAYVGKGLVYQNAFIHWYNHKDEAGYSGPAMEAPDGAVIIGGGLASLDVAKALMFENVGRALRQRGRPTDLLTLDRSIQKVLEAHQLTLDDLNVRGPKIYYRRRPQDMPLCPLPADTPEQQTKARRVRLKVLKNFQSKYLVDLVPQRMPVDKIVENERLAGLIFRHTEIRDGRAVEIPGTEETVRAPLFVSSIGSLPENIEGIPMQGQVYQIEKKDCCRLKGFENVFAIGNAVTGRGNIKESLDHGKRVTENILDMYLCDHQRASQSFRKTEGALSGHLSGIHQRIHCLPGLSEEKAQDILSRVEKQQKKAGYDNDFSSWVERGRKIQMEQTQ